MLIRLPLGRMQNSGVLQLGLRYQAVEGWHGERRNEVVIDICGRPLVTFKALESSSLSLHYCMAREGHLEGNRWYNGSRDHELQLEGLAF